MSAQGQQRSSSPTNEAGSPNRYSVQIDTQFINLPGVTPLAIPRSNKILFIAKLPLHGSTTWNEERVAEFCHRNKIFHIVNLCGRVTYRLPERQSHRINIHHCPIRTHNDEHVEDDVRRATGKVTSLLERDPHIMIHCKHGLNRSGVVAVSVMRDKGVPLHTALRKFNIERPPGICRPWAAAYFFAPKTPEGIMRFKMQKPNDISVERFVPSSSSSVWLLPVSIDMRFITTSFLREKRLTHVAVKADGTRCMAVCFPEFSYVFFRDSAFYKVPMRLPLRSSHTEPGLSSVHSPPTGVFDCECVDGVLYGFDALVAEGRDIRHRPLEDRRAYLQYACDEINMPTFFREKAVYSIEHCNTIDLTEVKNDGVVCISDGPYTKTQFKFTTPTVDMLIKAFHSTPDVLVELYSIGDEGDPELWNRYSAPEDSDVGIQLLSASSYTGEFRVSSTGELSLVRIRDRKLPNSTRVVQRTVENARHMDTTEHFLEQLKEAFMSVEYWQ